MLALFNPITLLLASICAEWFAVAEAGPFTIKLPYARAFSRHPLRMTSARRINSCLMFARQNVAWIIPFLYTCSLLSAALYGSPAQNTVPRQFFYFVGSIALGGTLAVSPEPQDPLSARRRPRNRGFHGRCRNCRPSARPQLDLTPSNNL